MVDHIFTIEEIVAFVGKRNGILDVDIARSLAMAIQPVLDERLRLDRPYAKISQTEWEVLVDDETWLISTAVESLIDSISRFELLARIASRS